MKIIVYWDNEVDGEIYTQAEMPNRVQDIPSSVYAEFLHSSDTTEDVVSDYLSEKHGYCVKDWRTIPPTITSRRGLRLRFKLLKIAIQ